MPFYCVIVQGDGILIRHRADSAAALGLPPRTPTDDQPIIGFFTTRFLRAHNPSAARMKAMRLVADDWAAPPLNYINEGNTPRLSVDDIWEIGLLKYLSRRPRGHTFYGDGTEEDADSR
ncbi:MAG TPA: hypothetical protein VKB71_17405 [Rhizomicrobium sp.]|nr:hypothetical protein [Rhizomicrobium sp.]